MSATTAKKTRATPCKWSWPETHYFILKMRDTGKNWDKLADEMQKILHNGQKRSKEQLQNHLDALKKPGSILKKSFVPEEFSAPDEPVTEVQLSTLRQEHEALQKRLEKEHSEASTALKEIEAGEVLARSSKKRSIEEMSGLITASENERKKVRKERQEEAKNLANTERQVQHRLLGFLEHCQQEIQTSGKILNVLLMALTQQMPEIIPQVTEHLRAVNNTNQVSSNTNQGHDQPPPLVEDLDDGDEVIAQGNC